MKIKRKGFTLNIFEDCIESPREYYKDTNIGKMICFSSKWNIGDEHTFKNSTEFIEWVELHQKEIGCFLPIYLLDHSGAAISTTPFQNKWDSGKCGYIYCLKNDMKKENLNGKEAKVLLQSEVDAESNWLQNIPAYYSFSITDLDDNSIEAMGVFELTNQKEMLDKMKERSEHKFDFLFDAYLKVQKENYL